MDADSYFSDARQAEFVSAVGRGDIETAARLIRQGASVEWVGEHGMTPLRWAMAKQSLAGFKFLLANFANSNTVTRWRDQCGFEFWASAMEGAALMQDERYLLELLESGGDPNLIVNSSRQTPIFIALLHRRYKNASLLLKAGADINHRASALKTPINSAVGGRSYSSALFLLVAGADPRIADKWGNSAIDTAMEFGKAGILIGSEDDAAYDEFVAELKRRGLW